MKILALEFSTQRRSAAVIASREERRPEPIGVAAETIPRSIPALCLVEQALGQAQLEREQIDCVAIGLGPGSYAGIRSAIALGQGWQLARPIKLLGISSAECLAAQAQKQKLPGRISIVIDAQRDEFYLAIYEIGREDYREVESLHLADRSEVEGHVSAGEVVLGPEITKHFPTGYALFPDAVTLGEIALERTNFVSGEQLEPIYLRETSFVKARPTLR
jgi:tRNA threonylcarbamoyl adenosine modification protein YeaZ